MVQGILGAAILVISATLLVTSAVALAAPGTIKVLGHDIDRDRVAIPSDWGAPLTKPLEVQAAYNGADIFFRARFPADTPGIHHDYVVYEGGRWIRYGASPVGQEPNRLYEDRFAFHVDDGVVRGFANQGCAVSCHADLRRPFMYAAPSEEQVLANSYYRDVLQQTETRKYILEARSSGGEWWDVAWDDISAEDAERMEILKHAGVLLDQWHWRAARGGPIGFADDMHVLEYRHEDEGVSAFATNWNEQQEQPLYMFDPAQAGYAALRFDDVRERRVSMDQAYYLGPGTMVEFDPERDWQEGDAIPRRYLREPSGSRGAISAQADWADGWWTVELRRAMDTGNPDDKAFHEGRVYNLAFAFFTDATGNRFHYVTFPAKLGLGQGADINAIRFTGEAPDWNAIAMTRFTAYYPGQTSWQFLVSDEHPGAPAIRADAVACAVCHTAEGLALRAAGLELRSERESPRLWTWLAGLLGVIGIAVGGILLRRGRDAWGI
jgi:hypothetical protein